jgi:TM2 domain-containing membrane protein YozV
MKKLLTVLFLFTALAGFSNSKYVIDDAQVESLMEQSVAVQFDAESLASMQAGDPQAMVAAVLAFFLGGFGIHRVYLGGKVGLVFIYFFTCGGIFGIVPLIDFVVLLMNSSDISSYVGNDSFFMWN